MLDSIFTFFNLAMKAIFPFFTDLPIRVFNGILDAFSISLTDLGVPEYLTNLPALISSIPSDAFYWFAFFQFDVGFQIIMTSLLIRFAIKLTPFIG